VRHDDDGPEDDEVRCLQENVLLRSQVSDGELAAAQAGVPKALSLGWFH
jgi:hypothetical protein